MHMDYRGYPFLVMKVRREKLCYHCLQELLGLKNWVKKMSRLEGFERVTLRLWMHEYVR